MSRDSTLLKAVADANGGVIPDHLRNLPIAKSRSGKLGRIVVGRGIYGGGYYFCYFCGVSHSDPTICPHRQPSGSPPE